MRENSEMNKHLYIDICTPRSRLCSFQSKRTNLKITCLLFEIVYRPFNTSMEMRITRRIDKEHTRSNNVIEYVKVR